MAYDTSHCPACGQADLALRGDLPEAVFECRACHCLFGYVRDLSLDGVLAGQVALAVPDAQTAPFDIDVYHGKAGLCRLNGRYVRHDRAREAYRYLPGLTRSESDVGGGGARL